MPPARHQTHDGAHLRAPSLSVRILLLRRYSKKGCCSSEGENRLQSWAVVKGNPECHRMIGAAAAKPQTRVSRVHASSHASTDPPPFTEGLVGKLQQLSSPTIDKIGQATDVNTVFGAPENESCLLRHAPQSVSRM